MNHRLHFRWGWDWGHHVDAITEHIGGFDQSVTSFYSIFLCAIDLCCLFLCCCELKKKKALHLQNSEVEQMRATTLKYLMVYTGISFAFQGTLKHV